MERKSKHPKNIKHDTITSGGLALISTLWGLYLLYVAYMAISLGEAPKHMGPTLNVFLYATRIFGHPIDVYLGAGFLAAVGLLFVALPSWFFYRLIFRKAA